MSWELLQAIKLPTATWLTDFLITVVDLGPLNGYGIWASMMRRRRSQSYLIALALLWWFSSQNWRQIVFKSKILAIYKTSLPNIAQFHNSWSPSTHARLTISSLLSGAAPFPPLQENLVEKRIILIVAIVFTCNGNYCTAIKNPGLGHFTYKLPYHISQLWGRGQMTSDCCRRRRGGHPSSTFWKMET